MTPEQRVAAALIDCGLIERLRYYYDRQGDPSRERATPEAIARSWAQTMLHGTDSEAGRTLAADLALAAAVRQLPGDTDIAVLRLDADYGPEWHVRFHKRKGTGPTLTAAIEEALK